MIAELPAETSYNRKWYQIWWDIWRHPGEAAFRSLLKERNHSLVRGLIWVGLSSLVLAVYFSISNASLFQRMFSENTGFTDTQVPQLVTNTTSVVFGVCGFILYPILFITSLLLISGIYHLVAMVFSGYGRWEELVICMAAIVAPNSVFSALFGIITFALELRFGLGLIGIIISLLFVIYVTVLEVNALKVAENLGTGSAVATLFVPAIVLSVFFLCCFGVFASSLSSGFN